MKHRIENEIVPKSPKSEFNSLFISKKYLPYYNEIKGGIYWTLVLLSFLLICFCPFYKLVQITASLPALVAGDGGKKMQSHLWHLGKSYPVKEVLYQLATMYTVRNKISGLIPGSPMPGKSNDEFLATTTQRGLSSWQSITLQYTLGIQQKRNKFKQFCNTK